MQDVGNSMSKHEIIEVIGTPCLSTDKATLLARIENRQLPRPLSVDFTNVHIVTQRRVDPAFRECTSRVDYFVPDSQVLRWAVNLLGGRMQERIYGPDFMAYAIGATSPDTRHYLLGGSEECLQRLREEITRRNPQFNIVGARNGYFSPAEAEEVVRDIEAAAPDVIWVGLGTPKQQQWIHEHKHRFPNAVLLAVGFAFDVNAGTKKDAPRAWQKLGLTWLFRLLSEPRRLFWRYAKYNTLFLWFLVQQLCRPRPVPVPVDLGVGGSKPA